MGIIDLNQQEWLTSVESVLEVLNEGVIVIDGNHEVLFANSRFLEMTGFRFQDLQGDGPSSFYSPREWAFLIQQAELSFRTGSNRYTFTLVRKDGGRVPVIISSRSVHNSAGRFGIVTFADISEQVRAEEELRQANAKLQQRQLEIEEDLRLASRVQNSLTPRSVTWDNISIDAFYQPVHSIGGDFALVNCHDREDVNLLVCDVSGHGVGSALVANRIYSEAAAHMRSETPFLKMFGELNRFLMEDIPGSGMYVTVAAARINVKQRRLIFAGAGHPPAILARPGHNPLSLESCSMILGVFPDAVEATSTQEVQLQPDDRLVIYTDGITEAFNSRGEMLGTRGVQEIVRQVSSLPAGEMKQAILERVAAWRSGPATDDVSLVLAHIR